MQADCNERLTVLAQGSQVGTEFIAQSMAEAPKALRQIGLRVERLEREQMSSATSSRNDLATQEDVAKLRAQVAELSLRMPRAEHAMRSLQLVDSNPPMVTAAIAGVTDRQLAPFEQGQGIGCDVVSHELGDLFHRVDESEQVCAKLQDQLKGRIATMDKFLDKVANEVLGPDGAEVASAVALAVGAVENISSMLPKGVRLCVLGGTSWKDTGNKELVETIARQISVGLAGGIVVITAGMAGVQEAFVKSLGSHVPVVNLVSSGGSGYNVGQDINGGQNLEERMVLLGQLGDVYLTIEGGPVVAKEAKSALTRGAVLLPLISTGGASAGMFDFPAQALRKPNFATDAQWALLSNKDSPELTAQAVVEMIRSVMSSRA